MSWPFIQNCQGYSKCILVKVHKIEMNLGIQKGFANTESTTVDILIKRPPRNLWDQTISNWNDFIRNILKLSTAHFLGDCTGFPHWLRNSLARFPFPYKSALRSLSYPNNHSPGCCEVWKLAWICLLISARNYQWFVLRNSFCSDCLCQ